MKIIKMVTNASSLRELRLTAYVSHPERSEGSLRAGDGLQKNLSSSKNSMENWYRFGKDFFLAFKMGGG
jgi:hypothetical protein